MAATDEQFGYRITKDGRVRVSFRGRHVVTVSGRPAKRLSAQLGGAHGEQVQLLLAKATGNFKHGNERDAERKRPTARRHSRDGRLGS